MKFDIKDIRAGYVLCHKSDLKLISVGNIFLYKENDKQVSFCSQINDWFDYQGIENAICGRIGAWNNVGFNGETFTPKRFFVIQMN